MIKEINVDNLIVHCGACMTNRREILSRILIANGKNIPITNYGITISLFFFLNITRCKK